MAIEAVNIHNRMNDLIFDQVFVWAFASCGFQIDPDDSRAVAHFWISESWIEQSGIGINVVPSNWSSVKGLRVFDNRFNGGSVGIQIITGIGVGGLVYDTDIEGNQFDSQGASALLVQGGESGGVFSGNIVDGCSSAADKIEANVIFHYNAKMPSHWTLCGNQFLKVGGTYTPINNIKVYFGDYIPIADNTFESSSEAPIVILSGTHNIVANNVGYNPVGYIANPFTGNTKIMYDTGDNGTITSDWIYTNCASTKTIYISGGKVSAITVNGELTGITSGIITLYASENFSITFTEPPTLKVMGQ